MIVATAGHVDHGKTSLIHALTGVDTDALPQEKRRGMTIDLGFAYLPAGDADVEAFSPIGFVDVPGHQRFMRNLLSGIGGADCVLFVVAADDGPMPQTREHLAIVDLLEIRRGIVALTKADRVTAERLAEASDEVTSLLAGTSLRGSEIIPVSTIDRRGIDRLRAALVELACREILPPARGRFRLAVDRRFIVAGAGLIVTGTAMAGALEVGETVELLGTDRSARARSIHAQGRAATGCRSGQRCAINLAGLAIDDADRGHWVVAPGVAPPSVRFDASLRIVRGGTRAFASTTAVHLHAGAGSSVARVAVLGDRAIAPGDEGLVQIVVERPVGVVYGDRFILRDHSAGTVLGGGRVIDIAPPARGRSKPERLTALAALRIDDVADSLAALLDCCDAGVQLEPFSRNRNLTDAEANALWERSAMVRITTSAGPVAFSHAHWAAIREMALQAASDWHARLPADVGPPIDRLYDGTPVRLPRPTLLAVTTRLANDGELVKAGMFVRLPSHEPRLDATAERLWERVKPLLEARALRPPTVAELSYAVVDIGRDEIERLLKRASRTGHLFQVSINRYFLPQTLDALSHLLRTLADESDDGRVTAARFRDRSGLGRNLSIEVLEYFDRVRLTRRRGDGRVVNEHVVDFV